MLGDELFNFSPPLQFPSFRSRYNECVLLIHIKYAHSEIYGDSEASQTRPTNLRCPAAPSHLAYGISGTSNVETKQPLASACRCRESKGTICIRSPLGSPSSATFFLLHQVVHDHS
jgi:hypothetical protein